jgi:hypothetical protein
MPEPVPSNLEIQDRPCCGNYAWSSNNGGHWVSSRQNNRGGEMTVRNQEIVQAKQASVNGKVSLVIPDPVVRGRKESFLFIEGKLENYSWTDPVIYPEVHFNGK